MQIARSDDPGTKALARAKAGLSKYNLAGRIMEVEGEGKPAPNPAGYRWCPVGRRGGLVIPCRVTMTGKGIACALCRCHTRPGCTAGRPPLDEDPFEESVHDVNSAEMTKTEENGPPQAPSRVSRSGEPSQRRRVVLGSPVRASNEPSNEDHENGETGSASPSSDAHRSSTSPQNPDSEDQSDGSSEDDDETSPMLSQDVRQLSARVAELEQKLRTQNVAALTARIEQL